MGAYTRATNVSYNKSSGRSGGEGVVMPKTFIQINVCLLAYLPVNEHNAILNMGNILP